MADDGRVVAGRYRLVRRIGHGAMGVVWQAVDLQLGREVAVKQLRMPPGLSEQDEQRARQRVFREARIAARLHHPHAVAVHDVVGDEQGHPVLVLEYLPSRSLAAVLSDDGVLAPQPAARIGAQVASALAAAHAAGIVHRDVKPANILIAADGTAKLTDFGISRATGDVTVTQAGLLAGTPAFLAPEDARGASPSPASDVFSLGATLYAVVEGRPPFGDAGNPIAQLHRVAAGQAPAPRRAGVLTEAVTAMLRDDPASRPTMAQVADALAAAAREPERADDSTVVLPVVVAPPATQVDLRPLAVPAGRSFLSRRIVYSLLGVVAVGAVALTAFALTGSPATSAASPTTSSAAPSGSAKPAATTKTVDPARVRQAVTGYYGLLPDHPDQAWARLAPGLRTRDRDDYEDFWDDVTGLHVVGTPQVNGLTVTVRLEYTRAGKGLVRETHQLGLLASGDDLLINADRVLASTTTPPEQKKDDKGHGHGHGRGHHH